jgi:hypothetical protein
MAKEDRIEMTAKELRRLQIIEKANEKQITQKEAGEILGLGVRQIQRLATKVRQQGATGIIHGLRGRRSVRRIPARVIQKVLRIYRKTYVGFGPVLASEKLEERDGIRINRETLRQWLLEAGLWEKGRRRCRHRCWRERKAYRGEMVQMDGSHHDWLEGRGSFLVLMAYIDDATGWVYARFYDYEGTFPAMDSLYRYIQLYGFPQSIYLDQHDTYKSPKNLTLEEEFAGKPEPQSQFQRAVEELGVSLIYAYSPQAKGRIERLFGTFQNRVVKEMRLEGIATREDANAFLESYLPKYNQRFSQPAAQPTDLHRSLPPRMDLRKILCIQESRTVRHDGTLRYQGHWYQLQQIPPRKKVQVQEWIDGSLHLVYQQKEVPFQEICPPRKAPPIPSPPKLRVRVAIIPNTQHPWRKDPLGKAKRKHLVS